MKVAGGGVEVFFCSSCISSGDINYYNFGCGVFSFLHLCLP